MKTKTITIRVAARIRPVDKAKIDRYFGAPTIRALIEGVLRLSESSPYIRNKIREILKGD